MSSAASDTRASVHRVSPLAPDLCSGPHRACAFAEGPNAGKDALGLLAARGEQQAPEPIEINERRFLAPRREGAQLAECALTPDDANCELAFEQRERRGLWPLLVQTRRLQPGESLRWVYNPDPDNPVHQAAQSWASAAAEQEKRKVRDERMRELQRKRIRSGARNASGQFVRGGGQAKRRSRCAGGQFV